MGTNTKSETGERLDDRIVVMTTKSLKTKYLAMCAEMHKNPSEHIRGNWERELAEYEANA